MKPPLPGDASPFAFGDDPNDHRPRDPSSFYLLGTVLFIASLAMLFGASMIGYLQSLPDHVDLQLPAALWLSTFVLLGSGVTIQLAANAARRDDQPGTHLWLIATGVTTFLFLAIQTPCMIALLMDHGRFAAEAQTGVYGFTFTLIVLHAAHVIGGMAPIIWMLVRTSRDRVDTRRPAAPNAAPGAVRACAVYWHFLEIVWLVMFATFLTV